MNQVITKIGYKGYSLIQTDEGTIKCTKKSMNPPGEPMVFNNMENAKTYIDGFVETEMKDAALARYQAKYGDHKVYTIILSKMNGGRHAVCDIENKNLMYGENCTSDGTMYTGMQCNHMGGTKNHEHIQKLCHQVADIMIQIHTLNNDQ